MVVDVENETHIQNELRRLDDVAISSPPVPTAKVTGPATRRHCVEDQEQDAYAN